MADVFGRRGFGRAIAYTLTAAACGLAFASPPAGAQTGGTAPTPEAVSAPSTPVPRLGALRCLVECAGVRAARTESVVRVRGRDLEFGDSVVFLGVDGAEDDVTTDPVRVRARYIDVRVPRRARTGPVAVVTADGLRSAPSRATLDVVSPAAKRSVGAIEMEVLAPKVFFAGTTPASVTFLVGETAAVIVELVRSRDGAVVYRWDMGQVPAATTQTVTWDGTAGGKVQADGRYEFRVFATGSEGVTASSSQAEEEQTGGPHSFLFLRHKFPVRGPHQYGEFAAAFGGGRGHQGQDVFAECGTPLVAARGGVVKFKQTHSRAGHYIVIDGEATDVDYVYMHMRDKALVNKGDRVLTGQLLGYVGDTGRAHGCHLHFEMWTGPGWYSGGSAFDPLPELQAWDRLS